MDSLYSPYIKSIVHDSPPSVRGFLVDVAEFETYITLRLYRDNFESFSKTQRESIIVWLNEVIGAVRAAGVDCYPEVYPKAP